MHKQQAIISQLDVTIVQPETAEEVEALWPDFLEISASLPFSVHERFHQWLLQNPKVMIMFYVGPIPSAWILRELNQTGEAAEIQGCIRDRLELEVKERCPALQHLEIKAIKRLIHAATTEVERKVLDETFIKYQRQVIMIQFMEENLAVKGFAWKWGFKPAGKDERTGNRMYLLPATTYREKRKRLLSTQSVS